MIVSADQFMKKAGDVGFDLPAFLNTADMMSRDVLSIDLPRIQGQTPHLVLYTETDCFEVQLINKSNRKMAEEDDNVLVPFFELLKYVAH